MAELLRFKIAKVEEAERLVFGFASLSKRADGTLVEDQQDDSIEPAMLEKAVYDFVLESRAADEMHTGPVKGQLVESIVFTPEKLTKMGLPADAIPCRWWVGFQVTPEAFAKVQSGEYQFFSIAGDADRVPVEATA